MTKISETLYRWEWWWREAFEKNKAEDMEGGEKKKKEEKNEEEKEVEAEKWKDERNCSYGWC